MCTDGKLIERRQRCVTAATAPSDSLQVKDGHRGWGGLPSLWFPAGPWREQIGSLTSISWGWGSPLLSRPPFISNRSVVLLELLLLLVLPAIDRLICVVNFLCRLAGFSTCGWKGSGRTGGGGTLSIMLYNKSLNWECHTNVLKAWDRPEIWILKNLDRLKTVFLNRPRVLNETSTGTYYKSSLLTNNNNFFFFFLNRPATVKKQKLTNIWRPIVNIYPLYCRVLFSEPH